MARWLPRSFTINSQHECDYCYFDVCGWFTSVPECDQHGDKKGWGGATYHAGLDHLTKCTDNIRANFETKSLKEKVDISISKFDTCLHCPIRLMVDNEIKIIYNSLRNYKCVGYLFFSNIKCTKSGYTAIAPSKNPDGHIRLRATRQRANGKKADSIEGIVYRCPQRKIKGFCQTTGEVITATKDCQCVYYPNAKLIITKLKTTPKFPFNIDYARIMDIISELLAHEDENVRHYGDDLRIFVNYLIKLTVNSNLDDDQFSFFIF